MRVAKGSGLRGTVSAALLAGAVLAVWYGANAIAGEGMAEKPAGPPSKMQSQFDRLKGLAGTWTGKAGEMPVTVIYKVTAGGSAVVETLMPDTPHEMVTVYTLDGDDLIMTHYCASGNAPRMKASAGKSPNELHFSFTGATNMKASTDRHMHDLTIWLVDANHIKSEWVQFNDGKQAEVMKFEATRKS